VEITQAAKLIVPGVKFENPKLLPGASQNASRESLVTHLYQVIFSLAYADSLAFLNKWKFPAGIFEVADLMTVNVAQNMERRLSVAV